MDVRREQKRVSSLLVRDSFSFRKDVESNPISQRPPTCQSSNKSYTGTPVQLKNHWWTASWLLLPYWTRLIRYIFYVSAKMSNGHHQILRVRMTRGVVGVRSGSHFHLPEEKEKKKEKENCNRYVISLTYTSNRAQLSRMKKKKEILSLFLFLVNAVG